MAWYGLVTLEGDDAMPPPPETPRADSEAEKADCTKAAWPPSRAEARSDPFWPVLTRSDPFIPFDLQYSSIILSASLIQTHSDSFISCFSLFFSIYQRVTVNHLMPWDDAEAKSREKREKRQRFRQATLVNIIKHLLGCEDKGRERKHKDTVVSFVSGILWITLVVAFVACCCAVFWWRLCLGAASSLPEGFPLQGQPVWLSGSRALSSIALTLPGQ